MKNVILLIIGLAVLAGALWLFDTEQIPAITTNDSSSETDDQSGNKTVTYLCADDVTLTAKFEAGKSTTSVTEGEMQPGGSVTLTTQDGITAVLPQTVSASGSRYASPGESFVFWSKGDGALVLENGTTSLAYRDCLAVAPEVGNLKEIYHNDDPEFTLRYPTGWEISETNNALGGLSTSTNIEAVFTVDPLLVSDTNLGDGTGLWIVSVADTEKCTPAEFLQNVTAQSIETIDGVKYMVAKSVEAAAGNKFELTLYVEQEAFECLATVEFIHSNEISNYDPGTVTGYDEADLRESFAAIRNSIRLSR